MSEIAKIVFITSLLCFFQSSGVGACINEDPCVCEIDETRKIDLNQLSQKLKIDEFLNDEDLRGNFFFFHGCKDGTLNTTAYNFNVNATNKVFSGSLIYVNTTYVAVNKTVDGKPVIVNTTVNFVQTAKSSEIKFVELPSTNLYQLVYKSGEKVKARIQLICSPIETSFINILSVDGTDPSLVLTSPNACIITHKSGLSTGSVLLILFFVSFGVYFIGGCLILYFMRGARGVEIIPNIDFWRSLPGLAKDGFIFLFSGCKTSSITTPETYDRI